MSAIRCFGLLLGMTGTIAVQTACIEDVGTGKTEAKVTESTAAPHKKTEGTKVEIAKSKSKISALSAKVSKKHPIDFHEWSGFFTMDGDAIVGLNITIEMASLEADHAKLTKHLKNGDFFEVDTYPQATFSNASVIGKAGEEGATHEVTGDLTMRGKTKRVTFPATISTENGVQASAEFVINRQDFGISYPGRKDDLIQDNVVMTIDLKS